MASIQRKSLDQADETRPVDKGTVEVIRLDAATMMRTTFQPGWRWSECVKPLVGGESCQVNHVGYCVSGRLHVRMENGDEMEIGAGDASHIPPGHDAWVVGDEPYVAIDFSGAEEYAKPRSASPAAACAFLCI
jgi:quercetin dioxygenase-like cupin family protein